MESVRHLVYNSTKIPNKTRNDIRYDLDYPSKETPKIGPQEKRGFDSSPEIKLSLHFKERRVMRMFLLTSGIDLRMLTLTVNNSKPINTLLMISNNYTVCSCRCLILSYSFSRFNLVLSKCFLKTTAHF